MKTAVHPLTIADLIEGLRATRWNTEDPEYHRAGRRLAFALAKSGPVIHGHSIYTNNSTEWSWQIVISAVPDLQKLMPWAVRLGLRAARPGDYPSEMALCRRYGFPIARVRQV